MIGVGKRFPKGEKQDGTRKLVDNMPALGKCIEKRENIPIKRGDCSE